MMKIKCALQNEPVNGSLVCYRVLDNKVLEFNNEDVRWFTKDKFHQHYQNFYVKDQRTINDGECFISIDSLYLVPYLIYFRVQEPEKVNCVDIIQAAIFHAITNRWRTIEIPLFRTNHSPDPEAIRKDAIRMLYALRIIWWQDDKHVPIKILIRLRTEEAEIFRDVAGDEIPPFGAWDSTEYVYPCSAMSTN